MKDKTSRIQKKAKSEIDVIMSCDKDIKRKIEDKKREKKLLLNDIANLNEKIKKAASKNDEVDFAKKAIQIENNIESIDMLLLAYDMTESKLNELINIAVILYENGDYRYIVKTIPEKKLPELVCNFDRVDELYEIVYDMVKEFNRGLRKLFNTDEKFKALKNFNHGQSVLDNSPNLDNVSDSDAEFYISKIKNKIPDAE